MVDVRPFRGVRYNPARFGQDLSTLICPPYDVISAEENAALLGRSPLNMVRLEGPSSDPAESNSGSNRYELAAARFKAWRQDETLTADNEPAIYAYRHTFDADEGPSSRRGMIAALRLEPWERNEVRPHERTHAGPKEDRLALIRACRANFSPIWCLYDDTTGATERLWESLESLDPDARAVDDDGVVHELWRVSTPEIVADVHRGLATGPAYIADGHHRYETALHYRDEAAEEAGRTNPDAAWNFTLTYFVEASDPGLIVLGTHRVISGAACNDLGGPRLRSVLAESFDLVDVPGTPAALLEAVDAGGNRPAFGVYAPGFGVQAVATLSTGEALPEAVAPGRSLAWRKLDLGALHGLVIDRLFPQGSAALYAAGQMEYTRELAQVDRLTGADARGIAFLVRTTPVQQVMAVADAGDRMPEKSTYFYPKPASGLVIARCDETLSLS